MIAPITAVDLESAYNEATKNNGIIDLLIKLRNPTLVIKVDELTQCFSSPLWNVRPAGGHRTLTHRVTKVVIGYQNHVSDVKLNIKKQLLVNVQEHMDFLNDKVFKFPLGKWNNLPDYNRALQNYNALS